MSKLFYSFTNSIATSALRNRFCCWLIEQEFSIANPSAPVIPWVDNPLASVAEKIAPTNGVSAVSISPGQLL